MKSFYKPCAHEEMLARAIVDCAYSVHSSLGPGLLEPAYEHCFCFELEKRQIPYRRQVEAPLIYNGVRLSWIVRLDVKVDDLVVCELKSVEFVNPVHVAQLLTQLKLVDRHLGFLINFNVALIKDGIRRVIR